MKILLLGKDGQLGQTLFPHLSQHGDVLALGRFDGNLENFDQLRNTIRTFHPDIIINAAAYTAVDQAEKDVEKAHLINGFAVGVIAEEALKLNAWFIHYSTEYVFDGTKSSSYFETDLTHPLNVYGKSKLAGEKAIEQVGGKYFILRTSWVYSPYRHNFALTILKKAQTEQSLNVVNDSFGSPTSTYLLTDVTLQILQKIKNNPHHLATASGIYHVTPQGETSWFDYAKLLIRLARDQNISVSVADEAIHPVSSDFYPSLAKRPKNSRLNTQKIQEQFGIILPDWREDVVKLVTAIAKK